MLEDEFARRDYVECVSTIGGHAKAAHEAAQDGNFELALTHLDAIGTWVDNAKKLLPDLKPMPKDVLRRIWASREPQQEVDDGHRGESG